MSYNESVELLNEALNELDLLIAKAANQELLPQLVDSFIDADERFKEFVKQIYQQQYADKEVPEDEEVPTVLFELVVDQKMTQDQVADLFDQFISAALLSTPGWFDSQPAKNFEETLSKIPVFYRAMCHAFRVMNRMAEEDSTESSPHDNSYL